jgi:primosomal protein N' (replication factor Y) (superfamily II helicase)
VLFGIPAFNLTSLLDIAGDPRAQLPTVAVLLPVALDQTYDYIVPEGADCPVGTFVIVPLGPQTRVGVVWDRPLGGSDKPLDPRKLKAVTSVLEVPVLPVINMRFAEWMAKYTISPVGMVLKLMMGAQAAFEPQKTRSGVTITSRPELGAKLSPARRKVLDVAGDGEVRIKSQLAAEAGVSTSVVDGLVTAGFLVDVAIAERRYPRPDPGHATNTFTDAQEIAVAALRAQIDGGSFAVSLLDGVTGSGKTEVYFEGVARALERGRQVIILLPEIALTSQFMNRFKSRFGAMPVEWHSALGQAERGRIWRACATGDARVVIGARSALFLPCPELGLIIVDEEHDAGFKQDDRVHYQARDMAVVRGNLGKIPIILASATPSIESHVNARTGKYAHIVLPGRFSGVDLPEVKPIDLRKHPPDRGRWLSPVLVEAMVETLAKGQQSLLFLNRRGYAPLTLCKGCGHRFDCPQCTAWLVEHRFKKKLTCHHCGFSLPLPEHCIKCGAVDSLVACGPGVERIAEEVVERFPNAKTVLLSSDLVPGLLEMRALITQIEQGEAQIIIGTQIVAKGHNFPDLSLVGIVDADLGLGQVDPRAAERTFQLLHQVTGRAGRYKIKGRGLVQTHMPEHPVMDAIIRGDRDTFIEREIRQRQIGMLPPYGRLAALIVTARDKELAERFAREIARRAPPAERIEVLGPAEAPIFVVRERYRWRLLVKSPRELDLQAYLRAWLEAMPKPHGDLRLSVDIDPYSFL